MEGLQRSTVSFRRQGSSGLVWDDRLFMSGELNKIQPKEQDQTEGHQENKKDANVRSTRNNPPPSINLERSQSNGVGGGRGNRTGKVQPAVEPPSPRVSACGFCGAFGKHHGGNNNKTSRRTKPGKQRPR